MAPQGAESAWRILEGARQILAQAWAKGTFVGWTEGTQPKHTGDWTSWESVNSWDAFAPDLKPRRTREPTKLCYGIAGALWRSTIDCGFAQRTKHGGYVSRHLDTALEALNRHLPEANKACRTHQTNVVLWVDKQKRSLAQLNEFIQKAQADLRSAVKPQGELL